jgi:acyl-CoA synthetase (AMP-forming)/AMP-acid ligase II/acyl carrier protein
LLVGGDVISPYHINKVRRENPGLKVLNGYGPTENTTFSTTYLIEKDFDHNIPIGKPVSNSTTFIFDKNLNYKPVGVIGELYVGGDGLSLGYLNRDDLNRKNFIFHPDLEGERLYKTGDLARWLPDGNIEFHGRADNQVKIRGFRVELEEIESVVSEIDGIIETVIKPVKIAGDELRLIAFLNVSDNFNTETKEIVRYIKEKLPSYMVPSAFKIMHGLPKNINGKIDIDALSFNVNDLNNTRRPDRRTMTPTESKIFNIWSDSLRTKEILAADNFFEIGGNSLLAISVFSKIESAFDVKLGLRVFFDSPRIKDIAEAVEIALHKMNESKTDIIRVRSNSNIVEGEI